MCRRQPLDFWCFLVHALNYGKELRISLPAPFTAQYKYYYWTGFPTRVEVAIYNCLRCDCWRKWNLWVFRNTKWRFSFCRLRFHIVECDWSHFLMTYDYFVKPLWHVTFSLDIKKISLEIRSSQKSIQVTHNVLACFPK